MADEPIWAPPVNTAALAALAARGLIAEPFPIVDVQAGAAIGSQRVEGSLLGLGPGQVVSQIVVVLVTAGAGTAPTAIKLGLLDANGNVLAATANVATDPKWTGGLQPIGFALAAPFTVPAWGSYYAAIYQNGAFATTAMQIGRVSANTLAAAAAAFGTGKRAFVEAVGQADLAGAIPLVNAGGGNANYIAAA